MDSVAPGSYPWSGQRRCRCGRTAGYRNVNPVARLPHGWHILDTRRQLTRNEVRVDPSSDPGRDEYGLPPVDIEIPDDARDLDRDVQAYHRELRVQRRHVRIRRLAGPMTRHGMVIPLVAGCLALTLLAGTLLTLIAGRQATPAPVRTSFAARSTQPTPSPSTPPRPLPDVQVTVNGKIVRLRTLVPAVLAWVPAACGCAMALRQLAGQAAAVHFGFYLVGTGRAVAQLAVLAAEAKQQLSHVVEDSTDSLGIAYTPAGLTAILANRSSTDVVRQLPGNDNLVVTGLQSLASTSSGTATPAPGQSGKVSPAS